jgi:preprotein translocase subunit SecG
LALGPALFPFSMSILIVIFTFILILISLALILVVLAQKAKSDGGMGSAMGGGMAEAAFGAETGNVLSTFTIRAAIAFFVISFGLYLGQVYQHKHAGPGADARLPTMLGAPAAPAPTPTAPPANALPVPAAPAPQPAKP